MEEGHLYLPWLEPGFLRTRTSGYFPLTWTVETWRWPTFHSLFHAAFFWPVVFFRLNLGTKSAILLTKLRRQHFPPPHSVKMQTKVNMMSPASFPQMEGILSGFPFQPEWEEASHEGQSSLLWALKNEINCISKQPVEKCPGPTYHVDAASAGLSWQPSARCCYLDRLKSKALVSLTRWWCCSVWHANSSHYINRRPSFRYLDFRGRIDHTKQSPITDLFVTAAFSGWLDLKYAPGEKHSSEK